ncbi:MAG TPA: helix-turn-helix domain-containing protein [Galbitalea sp.]|nr:helix-turn-helix domain-containing protein [Galbitalea sp.]
MRPTEPKQSFTGIARREQITRAAIEVLASDGFAATSIAAIADRLEVSKGILSYHFPAKAELLQGVVTLVLNDAASWMKDRMGRANSFRGALHTYIASNLSYLDGHRTEILALTEVLANARAVLGVPELFERSQTEAVTALVALFDAGRAAGEFGDVSSRMLAVALRATIDSTSASIRLDPRFDLSRFEHELTHLFDRATSPIRTEREEA